MLCVPAAKYWWLRDITAAQVCTGTPSYTPPYLMTVSIHVSSYTITLVRYSGFISYRFRFSHGFRTYHKQFLRRIAHPYNIHIRLYSKLTYIGMSFINLLTNKESTTLAKPLIVFAKIRVIHFQLLLSIGTFAPWVVRYNEYVTCNFSPKEVVHGVCGERGWRAGIDGSDAKEMAQKRQFLKYWRLFFCSLFQTFKAEATKHVVLQPRR